MSAEIPLDRMWKLAEQAILDGDVAALDALLCDHGEALGAGPVRSAWWGGPPRGGSPADARSIIAREHHFASWDEFAAHAEAASDSRSPAARFEAAVDAVVAGDKPALRDLLGADPDLVRARSTRRHHATLLHYVGANGVEEFRQRTPPNAVAVAEALLDAGADVDAMADVYGGSSTLDLVATSIHPATAGVQEDLMALLLERGAALGREQGAAPWSTLINACHANGRGEAAAFLARRAPALDLEAAAGVGRLDAVRSFFGADGRLGSGATEKQLKDGFAWACEYGRTEVVDFLLRNGVDVGARLRHDGQTGLHWAAYGGHADTVDVLLQRNAPVDARDGTYGGTPLGWALYAWGGGAPRAGGSRYYDVVRLLVAAGATVDETWLSDAGRGFPLADRIREDAGMRAALGRLP